MSQREFIQSLRDLAFSLGEYPAEWPEDLLVEAEQYAAMVKGRAQAERLIRAMANSTTDRLEERRPEQEVLMPIKPRGDCPVCGRSIQLKTDGTVRHHGGEKGALWPYRRAYWCKGSHRQPKGRTEEG